MHDPMHDMEKSSPLPGVHLLCEDLLLRHASRAAAGRAAQGSSLNPVLQVVSGCCGGVHRARLKVTQAVLQTWHVPALLLDRGFTVMQRALRGSGSGILWESSNAMRESHAVIGPSSALSLAARRTR